MLFGCKYYECTLERTLVAEFFGRIYKNHVLQSHRLNSRSLFLGSLARSIARGLKCSFVHQRSGQYVVS